MSGPDPNRMSEALKFNPETHRVEQPDVPNMPDRAHPSIDKPAKVYAFEEEKKRRHEQELARKKALDFASDIQQPFQNVRPMTVREENRIHLQDQLQQIGSWQFWRKGERARLQQSIYALDREIQEETASLDQADVVRGEISALERERAVMVKRTEATNFIDTKIQDLNNRVTILERGIKWAGESQKIDTTYPVRKKEKIEPVMSADQQQLKDLTTQLNRIAAWKFWRGTDRQYLEIQIEALKNKIAKERSSKFNA